MGLPVRSWHWICMGLLQHCIDGSLAQWGWWCREGKERHIANVCLDMAEVSDTQVDSWIPKPDTCKLHSQLTEESMGLPIHHSTITPRLKNILEVLDLTNMVIKPRLPNGSLLDWLTGLDDNPVLFMDSWWFIIGLAPLWSTKSVPPCGFSISFHTFETSSKSVKTQFCHKNHLISSDSWNSVLINLQINWSLVLGQSSWNLYFE